MSKLLSSLDISGRGDGVAVVPFGRLVFIPYHTANSMDAAHFRWSSLDGSALTVAKTRSAAEVVDLSAGSGHHLGSMSPRCSHLFRLFPVLFELFSDGKGTRFLMEGGVFTTIAVPGAVVARSRSTSTTSGRWRERSTSRGTASFRGGAIPPYRPPAHRRWPTPRSAGARASRPPAYRACSRRGRIGHRARPPDRPR